MASNPRSRPSSPKGCGSPSAAARQRLGSPREASPPLEMLTGKKGALSPRKLVRPSDRHGPGGMLRKILGGRYELGRELGRGSFATVRLAEDLHTGGQVAVKVVSLRQMQVVGVERGERDEYLLSQIASEVDIMRTVDHPSVVKLHAVSKSDRHIFIVMDFMDGGDLYSYVEAHARQTRRGLPVAEALRVFARVLDAVAHCHAANICHRDLKPENILLSRDRSEVKVADFGLARPTDDAGRCQTRCGSPHYMAPEQFRADAGYDGQKADVWGLGVVLFVITTATMPFGGASPMELMQSIVSGRHGRIPSYIDEEVADLIRSCLTVDADRRPTAAELLQHPVWDHFEGRSAALRPASPTMPGALFLARPSSPTSAAGEPNAAARLRRDSLRVLKPCATLPGQLEALEAPVAVEGAQTPGGASPATSSSLLECEIDPDMLSDGDGGREGEEP